MHVIIVFCQQDDPLVRSLYLKYICILYALGLYGNFLTSNKLHERGHHVICDNYKSYIKFDVKAPTIYSKIVKNLNNKILLI